ncbi:hypothetical protein EVAR_9301_1 [Eumeta japonica]|uniref:Uncharacterized protein n=1 Tax=Eumeta variegata TaxID=151549 RepID=A0A4C1TLX6_EUMVA|nr:hypothetical protein EVAR_9301_1 [Eumeta japonica]
MNRLSREADGFTRIASGYLRQRAVTARRKSFTHRTLASRRDLKDGRADGAGDVDADVYSARTYLHRKNELSFGPRAGWRLCGPR